MKVVSTKVTNPEWGALVDKCNVKGMTIAEYLRELLQTDSGTKPNTHAPTSQDEQLVETLLDRIRRNRETTERSKQEPASLSELLGRSRRYHR